MESQSTARVWWRRAENLLFWFFFVWFYWQTCAGLAQYLAATAGGKGFLSDLAQPWHKQEYYKIAVAIIGLAVSVITFWEILRVWLDAWRNETQVRTGGEQMRSSGERVRATLGKVIRTLKPTFLSSVVSLYLPRLIVLDIFWSVHSHLEKLALFHVGYSLLGWLYGLFVWDLATWVYHFTVHRVRLLWCMHAPHHAPEDLTITTAWVHFFGEGWFTTTVQILVLSVLGVPAGMLLVFMAFEVSWGTLIHTGERVLKTGRLGPLRWFLMTPSYHRVHHAKNPIYMDTNFCTLLPLVDWLMGTLQPLRDEVRPEYGITRKVDVASFTDFYFGEFIALWRDLRGARSIGERLRYLFKPPGWSPAGTAHTAAVVRGEFLAAHPELRVRGPRGVDAWFSA